MKSKSQYTPVRFSHLASSSGVGAIVRGAEDKLMVVVDTRYWTDKEGLDATTPIPYVRRITQALNISGELRMPPAAQEIFHKGNISIEGSYLPAVLFPTYARCAKCGLLHPNPWKYQNKEMDEKVFCECSGILKQVVWCCVSNKGDLDEVPWHAVSHEKFKGKCEPDYQKNYLKFDFENGTQIIKCLRCNSSNKFDKQQLGFINRPQPWIYEPAELGENFKATILEVNDSSVYSPESEPALVIPPESRISKGTVVDRLYNNSTALRELESIRTPLRKKGKLKTLSSEYRCTVEDIKNAIDEIDNGYPNFGTIETTGDLMADEYKAFLTPLENPMEDEDFVTNHKTDEWNSLVVGQMDSSLLALIKIVDRHIIAKRLREILVFKGFKRGYPEDGQEQPMISPDIVGVSDWLPAIELFGEGVFFTFDEEIICKWEKLPAVKKRANEVLERYEKSSQNLGNNLVITSRFILLHTLAHLVIREFESSVGYPAASLSERIYHSKSEKMAGILIYTAVPDVVGSLGGIIESSQPKAFLKIINNAFKHALWCSLDPVCTEHKGQGPGWLNRAACHGCVLVPETTCEYGNVFLDRVFIKGSKELGIPNFLEFVAEYGNG